MSARSSAWLWVAQRASAMVLAAAVLVHLATMIYAVRQGLTATAMLERAHASLAWPVFYAVFVIGVAIHAPLGLRVVLDEWGDLRGRVVDVALAAFAVLLLVSGLRAVYGVTLA
ncbi:MAG TPA: succinate dehydrogenase [Casimicrobiaceae bacterium]|nr:succinate dehydrogenase [Casimicrobiaceae bacterium]